MPSVKELRIASAPFKSESETDRRIAVAVDVGGKSVRILLHKILTGSFLLPCHQHL